MPSNRFRSSLIISAGLLTLWSLTGAGHARCQPSSAPVVDGHPTAARSQVSARDIVNRSLEAMGGKERIKALKNVVLKATEYQNHLGDSERPEGPYLVEFHEVTIWNDLENDRFRRTTRHLKWAISPIIVFDSEIFSHGINARMLEYEGTPTKIPPIVRPSQDILSTIYPTKILLTALDGEHLARYPDTIFQNVSHHVVGFEWHGKPYKIYINGDSDMISAVEVTRSFPYDIFWNTWGDVTQRIYYTMWELEPNGIRYPLQFDVEMNGSKFKAMSLKEVAFDESIPDSLFDIPESVVDDYDAFRSETVNDHPLSWGKDRINTVADGIVQIAGNWNATIVKQEDGIVIIEAPISTGYSSKVIAEANRRYPGVPIKALVTASDGWWHIAGVREYVARGIPIYANAKNKPILERLVAAPRTQFPDSLQKIGTKPQFHFVTDRAEIGTGPNRMILIPARTESLDRLMIAYFPEHKLAYTSEMIQPDGQGGFFWDESLLETRLFAEKEHLDIDTFIGMHMEPTPWSKMTDYLDKYPN